MRIRSLAQSLPRPRGGRRGFRRRRCRRAPRAAWRLEDPSLLTGGPPRYGSGANGLLDTGGNNNTVTINRTRTTVVGAAGSSQLVVGASGGPASEQLVSLHDSQGAGAGRWSGAPLRRRHRQLDRDPPAGSRLSRSHHAQVLVVPQYILIISVSQRRQPHRSRPGRATSAASSPSPPPAPTTSPAACTSRRPASAAPRTTAAAP